jgi:SAM-dependent methyltransferase
MDVVALKGVDVVHDFNVFPYPFKDSAFDLILANHALEHVNDLLRVMEEFQRILAPGGVVQVMVPYFSSPNAYRDPTHKIWFTSQTFSYCAPHHYYSKASFVVLKKRVFFFSNANFMTSKWYSWPLDTLFTLTLPLYERFLCYLFPISEIHFLLQQKNKQK